MKTNYTKGNWKVQTPYVNNNGIWECNIESDTEPLKPALSRAYTSTEVKANAKLIASAPDLLENANNLVSQIIQDIPISSDKRYLELCKLVNEMQQAIKKATE